MTNLAYVAVSLDGYIATKEGRVDWLNDIPNPEQSDYGFSDFLANIDAVVMGRKTFETVLESGLWPYPLPVFVLSSNPHCIPPERADVARVIAGAPHQLTTDLRDRGHANLYIDGGQTIQSFLAADLIDELILTRIPILLGDGIPLFGPLDRPLRFSFQKTSTPSNRFAKNYYRRDRG